MQKTKSKILTILLLAAVTLAVFPLAVYASTGFIYINSNTPPSPSVVQVQAGGNINLNLRDVLFSGGQFYLYLSKDGFSQVSAGDIRYTPSFNLATLQSTTPTIVTDSAYPGSWTLGTDAFGSWVNGTIPKNIPGGLYYIKCYDGAVTSLAVTDKAFTVIASVTVAPSTGAAGTPITITGNAFPLGALVNVTYVNPFTTPASLVTVNNLTATGSIGNFSLPIPAPDLKQVEAAGDTTPNIDTITFTAQDNATGAIYTATYAESQRGLLQFGRPRSTGVTGSLQNATGIYGNMTRFDLTPTEGITTVTVGVGDNLRMVGNWFYPGAVNMKWDNAVWGGSSANDTGYFNTTLPVPQTGLGSHNITITDSNSQVFVIFVNVQQSITISPTSGPIGTAVTVNGYGFPAPGAGNAYNVTIAFEGKGDITSGMTNSSGQFTAAFVVPSGSFGGAHAVTATANDTAATAASKTFTVQPLFTITPNEFYANSSNTAVVGTGTGADTTQRYFVAIDNLFSPFTNTTNGIAPDSTGTLKFTFIGVGFQPGLHVVSLYVVGLGTGGTYAPVANATFNVLSTPDSTLTYINNTVTSIKSDTTVMKANITTIVGWGPTITGISNGVASIQGTLGTMTTTLSSIQATLGSVSGSVAQIQTTLGTVTADLATIHAVVVAIADTTATINTDVGYIKGTVTSTDGKVATIQTDIGTLTMDVANLQTSVDAIPNKVNIPIYIAAAFAIVAAIAAIMSLIMMRRKIAG